ncbi:MAG: hypothetical protein J7M38_07725 [Armatimonadetes bacterium]|nr:hypothetical protein [Armatimonadota bacterium]
MNIPVRPGSLIVLIGLLLPVRAVPDAVILKPALSSDAMAAENLLPNSSLEDIADGRVAQWQAWDAGYDVDERISHSGKRSVRCSLPTTDVERGIGCTVTLNQTQALPIIATGWSRAENVSGSPDRTYSLYLDLEYMDGTPLWGQTATFDCGTHDWQKRTVTIIPPKPVRSVIIYGIFRHKTGTVWFDDFTLTTLKPTARAAVFDSVPVVRTSPPALTGEKSVTLATGDGLKVRVHRATGAVLGPEGAAGGFFWRDAAAGSDFRQPRATVRVNDRTVAFAAEDPELALKLKAEIIARDDHIAVHGTVEDTTGEDRAVVVYFSLPMDATGWTWYDDARTSRAITPPNTYTNRVKVNAGAGGSASLYPLAAVAGANDACALAVPLTEPRIVGMGYDADSREFYAGFHLGLSAETRDFPSRADFSLVIYRPDPAWGFRSALKRYYELFPSCFTRRNTREGIWMPFTDVSTVDGWQDFGFQFHEGNNNVTFDDEAGIYSFVYVEPVSHWLAMPRDMPRTVDQALALLQRKAEQGDRQSRATLTSAIYDGSGRMYTHIINVPWCDGALFFLNPLPSLLDDQPDEVTQWRFCSQALWRAFEGGAQALVQWNAFGDGYLVAPGAGRKNSQAIMCAGDVPGARHGAMQAVTLNQKQPTALVLRAWSKAEDVVGDPESSYCVYADLTNQDGTHSWGHKAAFEAGTHDWQQAEVFIRPEKPVRSATVYVLFRNQVTGRVWFDDVFFGEAGSDTNLLRNPGFEPSSAEPGILDGIYIDSAEMGATTPNFRRDHWRYATLPLTFTQQGRVCQLTIMNSVEFARALAMRLHDEGKMLMANSTPARFPWLAAWCDVMGTETNWGRGGEYTPQTDATLSYRRAMCYQRPYLLLLNTVYDQFPNEWVERYFKRAIAYGIFPSMFSHNASSDPYWQRPNLYNRDRELFKRYIPICQAIAAAGWEPVTHARCQDGDIWLERFGPGAGGELYLTVFNSSAEAREATISLDCRNLGIAAELDARDMVTGAPVHITKAEMTLSLDAEDLAVVRLRQER